MSGEPGSQPLALFKPCTLWASPANAGALELANELAAAFTGLTISTAEDPSGSSASEASLAEASYAERSVSVLSIFGRSPTLRHVGQATHMLLYLNENSFVSDERLAEQVKQARENKLKIVMAHENDPDKGGCQFSRFFEVTPQERMSHIDVRPEPPLPPQPSPPNATGAHRRRTLQGPGNLVLPRPPPHGACPLSPTENPVARIELCDEGRPCLQVSLVLLAKRLGATPARSQVEELISGADQLLDSFRSAGDSFRGGLGRVFAGDSTRNSGRAEASASRSATAV